MGLGLDGAAIGLIIFRFLLMGFGLWFAVYQQDLVARAADPEFAARVAQGQITFELADTHPPQMPLVTGTPRPAQDVLDKALVTERDIAALTGGARTVRLGKTSRLTPLARDEARRRGIRIERSET